MALVCMVVAIHNLGRDEPTSDARGFLEAFYYKEVFIRDGLSIDPKYDYVSVENSCSSTQVSQGKACNGCWVRARAFGLWTLCPTDFDFPERGLLVSLAFGRSRWLVSRACYIVAFRPFRPAD